MLKLMLILMKVSLLGLGGGYGLLPLMREELVKKRRILKEHEFLSLIAKAQSFPGSIAVNTAILLGKREGGIMGSILCTLSISLPPFFVILLVAIFFEKFSKIKFIENFLAGARIGVTIIILNFSLNLMKRISKNYKLLLMLIIASLIIVFLKIPAVIVFLVVSVLLVMFIGGDEV